MIRNGTLLILNPGEKNMKRLKGDLKIMAKDISKIEKKTQQLVKRLEKMENLLNMKAVTPTRQLWRRILPVSTQGLPLEFICHKPAPLN